MLDAAPKNTLPETGPRPRRSKVKYWGAAGALAACLLLAFWGREALGGGTLTRYPFGAETVFTTEDGGLSVESSWSAQGVLVVTGAALVAFLLGSRLWRLLA